MIKTNILVITVFAALNTFADEAHIREQRDLYAGDVAYKNKDNKDQIFNRVALSEFRQTYLNCTAVGTPGSQCSNQAHQAGQKKLNSLKKYESCITRGSDCPSKGGATLDMIKELSGPFKDYFKADMGKLSQRISVMRGSQSVKNLAKVGYTFFKYEGGEQMIEAWTEQDSRLIAFETIGHIRNISDIEAAKADFDIYRVDPFYGADSETPH